MFLVYMILIGLIAGGFAKLAMRKGPLGGLIVLGVGGSMIAGALWYAESQPLSLIPSVVGAAMLLVIYGLTGERRVAEQRPQRDDMPKAA
jgi:uncharacterized membrane protein YeaQ/YmgE (transglycosylase-associated protein family)